jgi:hypothetical protein
VTEALEVLYPWHPWFGRAVYIHEVIVRGGERSFRCDLAKSQTARCMEVSAWMFGLQVWVEIYRIVDEVQGFRGLRAGVIARWYPTTKQDFIRLPHSTLFAKEDALHAMSPRRSLEEERSRFGP